MTIVWRELGARDVATAKRFYEALFGWTITDRPNSADEYAMISANGREIGGIMRMPAELRVHVPPHWTSYAVVPDVDAATARWHDARGRVGLAPTTIAGVGRFSVLIDPWGAGIAAFHPEGPAPSDRGTPRTGEFCWESLFTLDASAARALYTSTFGWQLGPGPGGLDTLFVAGADGLVADLEQVAPGERACWLTYVLVADLEATCARVKELGGSVSVEGREVPGMGRYAVVADVEGAVFGLFEENAAS